MKKFGDNPPQTGSAPLPTFAWIAVTNRCNLRCTHCQRGLLRELGLLRHREMSWKVFNKLESEVFPHLKRIQFGGNNFGEQLLASNWDSFFERISKLKLGISIVTNGTLLNTSRIKAMVEAGVELNFSLEGVSKEAYEAVRGYKFDKFFGIIKKTCEEKIRLPENGAQVNLGFTIFKDNIREVTDLIGMAARLEVDRIVVTHFAPWQENQRRQSLVYHKELSNRMLEKAKYLARELDIMVDLPMLFRIDNIQENPDPLERGRVKPCYHPWRSFSVNERGDVIPCCATSVVMGNLERSSFYEIWNGSKYQRLRKTVNSSRPLVFCRDCAFREIEVGSTEPISFWSDEEFLLSAIGTERRKNSTSLVLRKMKSRLRKSSLGQKALPHLTEFYRKHGAFYVADIYDSWMTPLAKRLSRKR
jgi:radical SAM protein with 4Fe4S-binding SPASM domain